MTAYVQDKIIAHKAKSGGKLISSITYTKVKGESGGKPGKRQKIFKPSNLSPLTTGAASPRITKRPKQTHPGNSSHIHWSKLNFCEYCNYGVHSEHYNGWVGVVHSRKYAELSQHQSKSKTCTAIRERNEIRYVFCQTCSTATNACCGHLYNAVCPRVSSQ